MYLEAARSATSSDHLQYFISLKNGRWRPVDVPPGTLAVMYRGEWRVVFSRAETDEEYFAAHPEARFRLMVRPRNFYRGYFTFTITTRDPEVYADGDAPDMGYYDANQGTPRDWMFAECERMLADPHRCSDSERWLASQGTRK